MLVPYAPSEGLVVLPDFLPAPGVGGLPINAHLVRGGAPVLVDTGMGASRWQFLEALDCVVDAAELAAIVLTHEDGDHAGALADLLERAPRATLVATGTGLGKLSAEGPLPLHRVQVVEHGQRIRLGGRRYLVVEPPMYDSPATFMLFEEDEGWLFSSDAFGAFTPGTPETAEELGDAALVGMRQFCLANSPWIPHVERSVWQRRVAEVAALRPSLLLASHLPPASGLVEALFDCASGLQISDVPSVRSMA